MSAFTIQSLRAETETTKKLDAPSLTPSTLRLLGSAGIESMNYFTPYNKGSGHYTFLNGDLKVFDQGKWVRTQAEVAFKLTVNSQEYRNFEVPQLFFSTHSLNSFQLAVGRKRENWSDLDDKWGLGVFQPRYRWDFLNPQPVGLSGAFLRFETDDFQILGFGSPIFIPDRGMPIELSQGNFRSGLGWAVVPPSQINVFDRQTPVRYRINAPSIMDIIAHAGGVVQIRAGKRDGFHAQGSYGLKPINQLLLGYDGFLDLNTSGPFTQVDIFPRVLYHHVAATDFGLTTGPVNSNVSMLYEVPIRDNPSPNWVTQELSPALVVGTGVDWYVQGRKADRSVILDFGYIRALGGDAQDKGDFSQPGKSVFESRFPYKSTFSIGGRGYVPIKGWRDFSLSTKFYHDTLTLGSMLKSEIRYQPNLNWKATIGADILGVQDGETTSGIAQDFYRQYQARDRVYGGLTYVF